MFSQSCNCLPNKGQSSVVGQSSQNMGLLRSLSRKPFSKFENSSDYISLDFQATNKKNSNNFTAGTGNIGLMDLVYSFTETSRVKFDRRYISTFSVPADRSKLNCKEIISHCNTMATSPLVSSYLVGGFVGSKSQLGRRRKNDLGKINLWEIIRDVINLVGNARNSFPEKHSSSSSVDPNSNSYEILQDDAEHKEPGFSTLENKNLDDLEEPLNSQKQSYADVAKRPISGWPNESVKISALSAEQPNVSSSETCNNSVSVIKSISPCDRTNSFNRDRITSECSADSEDSFIVFECCEDENLDQDFDSSDDDIPSCFNEVSQSDSGVVPSSNSSFCSKLSQKKVRFAEGKKLVKVHPMVTWDFAYRMARRGPWEMIGRDAERFKRRIIKTEAVLKHVLDPQHRSVVFRDRFSNLVQ